MEYNVYYARLERGTTKYDLTLIEPRGLEKSISIARWDTPGKQPGDSAWTDKAHRNSESFSDKLQQLSGRGYKPIDGQSCSWPKSKNVSDITTLVDEFGWAFAPLTDDKRLRVANFLETAEMANSTFDEKIVVVLTHKIRTGWRPTKIAGVSASGEFADDWEHLANSRMETDPEPEDYAQAMPSFGAWS